MWANMAMLWPTLFSRYVFSPYDREAEETWEEGIAKGRGRQQTAARASTSRGSSWATFRAMSTACRRTGA